MSYNNRPATDAIPFLSPVLAPSARAVGPLLEQLATSPIRWVGAGRGQEGGGGQGRKDAWWMDQWHWVNCDIIDACVPDQSMAANALDTEAFLRSPLLSLLFLQVWAGEHVRCLARCVT